MVYFYGDFNKYNVIYKFFADNFPFINEIKSRLYDLEGKKRLCQILQRIESKIIIDGVFIGLKEDNYNTLPLHDAIMCNNCDRFIVKNKIEEEFKKYDVKYLPTFDKLAPMEYVHNAYEKLKIKEGSRFLNKNIVYEQMNSLLKEVGIKNRVWKEDMKVGSSDYIDTRFEKLRHLIPDYIAGEYYSLKEKLINEDFNDIDYQGIYNDYKKDDTVKKRYYARDSWSYIKINPVDYYNKVNKTNYKTRCKESKYIY